MIKPHLAKASSRNSHHPIRPAFWDSGLQDSWMIIVVNNARRMVCGVKISMGSDPMKGTRWPALIEVDDMHAYYSCIFLTRSNVCGRREVAPRRRDGARRRWEVAGNTQHHIVFSTTTSCNDSCLKSHCPVNAVGCDILAEVWQASLYAWTRYFGGHIDILIRRLCLHSVKFIHIGPTYIELALPSRGQTHAKPITVEALDRGRVLTSRSE